MIAVYGATGFIGNYFCKKYEHEVQEIHRLQDEIPPDARHVLYLISTIDNYNVHTDPHLDIQTNLVKLMKVLETLQEGQVFTFISSWFVYGNTDVPATEESPCNPQGFYSITKRTAEQLVESYCKTKNLQYQIFRLCNVYGETDHKASIKRNAMQHLIGELAENRDIKLYNNGTDRRDFMHVDDACRAIKFLMRDGFYGICPIGIVNICSGQTHSFASIMHYAKAKLDSQAKILSRTPPAFHNQVQVKDASLDNSLLKRYGWRPGIDIWEGIDRIIENL